MPQDPVIINITLPPPKVVNLGVATTQKTVTLEVIKHGPAVSGNAVDPVVRTAGFTAQVRTIHAVDLTGGPMTILPPVAPATGDEFGMLDVTLGETPNRVTIDFSGAKILGRVDSYEMHARVGNAVTFVYLNAASGWGILSSSN